MKKLYKQNLNKNSANSTPHLKQQTSLKTATTTTTTKGKEFYR